MSPRTDSPVLAAYRALLNRLRKAVAAGLVSHVNRHGFVRYGHDDADCLCPLALIARHEGMADTLVERIHTGAAALPLPSGQVPAIVSVERHAQGLMRLVSDTTVRNLTYDREKCIAREHGAALGQARADLLSVAVFRS